MTVFYQSVTKPVTRSHEERRYPTEGYKEFFSDMGFVIRGRTEEGEDIQLWTFLYIQRGAEVLVDGDVNQTLFIATKYSDEDKENMHNTRFINKGQNIEDYAPPNTIQIDETADNVVWHTSERTYTCAPPKWHVGGTHAGVEMDVNFTELSPGFFHGGEFETLEAAGGSAGYIMHCRCEGTIKTKEKSYKFKGYAVHERMLQSEVVSDRTSYMNGRGLNWIHGWSEELSFFCFQGDVGDIHFCGILNIGGESFPIEHGQGGIDETDYWLDPKSKIMTPYKWKIWMETDKGRLETEVYAYARGYYTWIRRHGTMVVNQLQADAKTTFTFKDGRVINIKQLSMVEHMRTLYRQDEDL